MNSVTCGKIGSARIGVISTFPSLTNLSVKEINMATAKLPQPCSISDCNANRVARGWCPKHWNRWRQNGSPHAVSVIQGDDERRFWSYVKKTETCWFWTGGTLNQG